MLCLSCIVVFCTIYVLILPAITLEKKTTCEEEQSAIQEEQPLVQEEDESIVQSTIQSDDSEDIEFVSCEPIEEETDDVEEVEITEDPEEEMDVDFASGEEDAIEAADENVMPEGGIAGGFDLSAEVPEAAEKRDYVKLSYKKEDGTWQEFSQENNAPEVSGNPPVRLEVKYKNVQISNLLNSYNCKLTYQLPTLLRDAKTAGKIMEGNQQVGTVTCENGKIVVEFDRSYLQGLLDKGDTTTTIAGDFYAEGNVDLSQLNPDGTTTLSTAGKTYYLNLGPDAVAKYGKINIEKTCVSQQAISTESGNYLAYTITVTAGEDGCPDVSVVDTIENKTSVDSYVGIDTTAKTLVTVQNGQNPYETIAEGKTHGTVYLGNTTTDSTNPVPTPGAVDITTASGSMVWKIGDMAAGEIRTLTYYVKLKDNVGLNDNEIKNKADVYSKTYKRVYDDASFTPKINYTMPKSHNENIVRNSDGTYTITYKIEFNLDGNNSNYALKNLEFRDYLDDQSDNIHTDSNALPYISYNRDSVKLYKGGVELPSKDYTVSWANGDNNYVTPWNDSNNNPTRFKITGANGKPITVNPGDSYYATYTVTVKPEALAAMQANNVYVKNRYYVHVSNAKSNFGDALNRYWDSANVGNYKWDEKIVRTGTTLDQTIEMGTDVKYDLTSETVKPDSSTDTSFTVPAGSYPYTVDVNQTLGEWNATNVLMKDELTPGDKMEYIGYAKVEACEYNANTNTYDVKGTKWVKIAGLSSFKLKPSELGWSDKNYAYRFTYYAMPTNANFSSAKVNNKFSLSGKVVKNGVEFDISNIYSQKEITVSGSFKMNVKKESWYYEEPKTDATTWQNGKLYWVIEVSGTAIMQNTYFRDAISKDSGLTDSYLHSDSLAGIYMGKLPEGKTITGYGSLEELQNTEGLTDVTGKFSTELTNDKNFTGTDNHSELSLRAKERIELENDKLYFIVRTEPQSLPTKYRDAFTFRNHISTSDNGNTWIDHGSAEKLLCGGADILKELGQTFTYDGTTVTSKNDGADQENSGTIITNELLGAGQYAAWAFKVNYAGELSAKLQGAVFKVVPCIVENGQIKDNTDKMWTGTTNDKGELLFGEGSDQNHVMDYNTIYKVTEETAPSGYVADSKPIYIMVPRKEENATDYSDYVNNCIKDSRIHIQYQSIYELTVLNHKGEITVEKKFKNAGGHDSNPVSGTYTFGLYENADGTNTTNSTNQDGTTSTTTPLQTITITYNAAETGSKTAKFTNLDLTDNQNQTKTYYVFELDDNGNPIKDSTTAATVNKMEYFTSYAKTTTDGTTTGVNSAVSGDTVTVTNQIRVKELPSTGSYGPLIFRLAGAVLIFFAGLQMLINIKKRACNNR